MLSQEEINAFRRMTPAEKLRLIAEMHFQAREMKRAAFRTFHPEWSEEEIERRVREVFLYGTG